MTETQSSPPRRPRRLFYVPFTILVAAATVGVTMLAQNISDRKAEARKTVFELIKVTENTIDPAEWGKNFPRQYDSYSRTVDVERTRHGGSDAFQKLDEDPRWRTLFNGYAFAVDYREERGHAYMLADQDTTERVRDFPQPGACLHCHSSIIPAYHKQGVQAGVSDDPAHRHEAIMKGFELVCAMTFQEARKLVEHPVSCLDCHDPESMQLRVTRPGFFNGIVALARSDKPVPHLPSIERWRKSDRKREYDPNRDASRQEMRSLACGQCHVEYYFDKKRGNLLTYPWHHGIRADEIEEYYDRVEHVDWKHADSGSPLLKAQHPEFEMWSQGIHARSGVSCADCHMPYMREGAIKVSSHHVRSPLLNVARSCQTCHRYPEEEILARTHVIQDRTKQLMTRAEQANVDLIHSIKKAIEDGAGDGDLKPARNLHRKAQWRLDFVAAENSMGFHAPQEAARLLGEAIDYARQGQIAAVQLSRSGQTAHADGNVDQPLQGATNLATLPPEGGSKP